MDASGLKEAYELATKLVLSELEEKQKNSSVKVRRIVRSILEDKSLYQQSEDGIKDFVNSILATENIENQEQQIQDRVKFCEGDTQIDFSGFCLENDLPLSHQEQHEIRELAASTFKSLLKKAIDLHPISLSRLVKKATLLVITEPTFEGLTSEEELKKFKRTIYMIPELNMRWGGKGYKVIYNILRNQSVRKEGSWEDYFPKNFLEKASIPYLVAQNVLTLTVGSLITDESVYYLYSRSRHL